MFNEENTVEQMVLDTLSDGMTLNMVADSSAPYGAMPKGWKYIPAERLPRQHSDVFVEGIVQEALLRLNPEIAAQPDRTEEVLYRLRAIVMSVQAEGVRPCQ